MLNKKNLLRGVSNPSLLFVLGRRWFPWTASKHDRECAHLISAWSSGKLPRVSIAKAFPGIENHSVAVRKPESRVIGWSLDLQELIHLLTVVKVTGAKKIFEIGTYDGFTALNVAANLDDSGEIYTLDLPQELEQSQLRSDGISNATISKAIGSKFRDEPESKKIRQVWGDSTRLEWGKVGGPWDLILIDGCHDYAFVRSDSLNALKHIRPGGTILWHDYGQCVDVSRAVDELSAQYPIQAISGTRFACLRVPTT